MSYKDLNDESEKMNRRSLVRKGAKVAYVVPAILAAVKATERPAYADTSGKPLSYPIPDDAPI